MARIEKLNCSNCGATLEVDLDAQIIECRFCGTRLLLEKEREFPFKPGIISKKHMAEVRQWLESLGVDQNIDPLELVYYLDLHGKEIAFGDLRLLAYFPNLSFLNMEGTNLNDEGTSYLKPLAGLETLCIGNTAVSDLAFADRMEKMKTVRAADTNIDDKGLDGIRSLAKMKTLDLRHTRITDRGIECLIKLGNLESLDVSGTLVTARGLKLVIGLHGLTDLQYPASIKDADLFREGILRLCRVKSVINLSCQKLVDSDLKELEVLKHIEMLDLRSNRITDSGLASLKSQNLLHYLDLSHNKITDAGIEHLVGLTRLRTLDLQGNRITEKGMKKLKKLFPNALIYA